MVQQFCNRWDCTPHPLVATLVSMPGMYILPRGNGVMEADRISSVGSDLI